MDFYYPFLLGEEEFELVELGDMHLRLDYLEYLSLLELQVLEDTLDRFIWLLVEGIAIDWAWKVQVAMPREKLQLEGVMVVLLNPLKVEVQMELELVAVANEQAELGTLVSLRRMMELKYIVFTCTYN